MPLQTGIILTISDTNTTYDVISCSYYFNQGIGPDGRPTGSVSGGQIQLSVVSTDDTGLTEWMCDASKFYDGKIDFYQPDDLTKIMKTLNFKRGGCVSYSESFTSGPSGSQSLLLTVNEISIGNADVNNNWPS